MYQWGKPKASNCGEGSGEAQLGDADTPLAWVGRSLDELKGFPVDVQRVMGFALRQAQMGEKHPDAKPLSGYGGAGVLEIVDDYDGDTYRAVYTVRFGEAVYVLYAFQKKAKRGIATPARDLTMINRRLRSRRKYTTSGLGSRQEDNDNEGRARHAQQRERLRGPRAA
jgi:phage-related protein